MPSCRSNVTRWFVPAAIAAARACRPTNRSSSVTAGCRRCWRSAAGSAVPTGSAGRSGGTSGRRRRAARRTPIEHRLGHGIAGRIGSMDRRGPGGDPFLAAGKRRRASPATHENAASMTTMMRHAIAVTLPSLDCAPALVTPPSAGCGLRPQNDDTTTRRKPLTSSSTALRQRGEPLIFQHKRRCYQTILRRCRSSRRALRGAPVDTIAA